MSPRKKHDETLKARRIPIALSCSVCGARNYKTSKVAADGSPPIVLSKFCSHCNQHTQHIEGR